MRTHQFVGKRTYTLISIYKYILKYNILFFLLNKLKKQLHCTFKNSDKSF